MTEKYIKRLFVLKDLGINIPSGYDVIYTYLCENYSRITVEDEKYLYRNIYILMAHIKVILNGMILCIFLLNQFFLSYVLYLNYQKKIQS